MGAHSEFWLIARFVLLLVGLLAPGAILMRALRVPATVATSFAGSALALYTSVIVLQLAGVTLSLTSLSAGLFVVVAVAHFFRRELDSDSAPSVSLLKRSRHYNPITGMGGWLPLYLVFWVAVVMRAWHEPLAGPDVEFRWSFLAEQMLRLGSLDFYPPQSASDFLSYFWVESIPPGTSALHAWAYACAGSSNAAWTIPATVLQLWSIHDLLWRTAERIGGVRAARFTCLAAAACPLLTWSVLIGQETGLTTLSLVGIAFAVHSWSETRKWRWAALAGIFAAIGASAREYGLVFPVLAIVGLVAVRADRRAWIAFLAVAAISVAWPLRTWVLTGNPVYSLTVGNNLPVNERFIAWIEHDADSFGAVLHSTSGWREIARYLLLYSPIAVLGWVSLLVASARRRQFSALALVAVAAVLILWALSVRYTNGGPFYSLRVASPALAISTLAAGLTIAAIVSSQSRLSGLTTCLTALLPVALLPATLALPRDPWRTPLRDWPAISQQPPLPLGTADETVGIVLREMARTNSTEIPTSGVVIADGPGYQRRFHPVGVSVIPLWSPQADWLFDAKLTPAETVRRWRDSRVTHLIVTKWRANLDFFNNRSRWSHLPLQVQLVGESKATAVFAIRAVE